MQPYHPVHKDIKNHPLLKKKVMVKPDAKWVSSEIPNSIQRGRINKTLPGNIIGIVQDVMHRKEYKNGKWLETTLAHVRDPITKEGMYIDINKIEPVRDTETLKTDKLDEGDKKSMKMSELKQMIRECIKEIKLDEKKLSYKEKHKLPSSDFVIKGHGKESDEKYPIPDLAHARNALSRVSANGTDSEKAKVRAAVHAKFPSLKEESSMTEAVSDIDLKNLEGKKITAIDYTGTGLVIHTDDNKSMTVGNGKTLGISIA